jgi:hypothetical protein
MSTGSSEALELSGEREVQAVALLLLLSEGVRGRYSASSLLGLREGVVRGLYEDLKELGYVEARRGGARITELGRRWLAERLRLRGILGAKLLEEVEAWGSKYAGAAASLEREVRRIVAARDAAVRGGAAMALIVKRSARGFYLPLVEEYDLEAGAPGVCRALEGLPEGRSYLVVLGESLYACVRGLLSAAAAAEGG